MVPGNYWHGNRWPIDNESINTVTTVLNYDISVAGTIEALNDNLLYDNFFKSTTDVI